MHGDKDLHSSLDSGPMNSRMLSCAMKIQKLTYRSNICLWCCIQPHTSLSGYLIKAAQPQSSTERRGLEGEEGGEEWWKIQVTEIIPGCSQGCPQESLSPNVQAWKTIKGSQHCHCFWLRRVTGKGAWHPSWDTDEKPAQKRLDHCPQQI